MCTLNSKISWLPTRYTHINQHMLDFHEENLHLRDNLLYVPHIIIG